MARILNHANELNNNCISLNQYVMYAHRYNHLLKLLERLLEAGISTALLNHIANPEAV